MSKDFDWPWQYNFPPFFTLQPNADTRRKQLDAWCQLVLAYHQYHKQFALDVQEIHSSPLFSNRAIDRKLSSEFVMNVLEELKRKGNLEWTDKSRRQCRIIWRTAEEWGQLIYVWAKSTGHVNSVCTLFELTDGDDTENEPFHGLDKDILLQAMNTLAKQGRAELIMFDSNEGVKFFA